MGGILSMLERLGGAGRRAAPMLEHTVGTPKVFKSFNGMKNELDAAGFDYKDTSMRNAQKALKYGDKVYTAKDYHFDALDGLLKDHPELTDFVENGIENMGDMFGYFGTPVSPSKAPKAASSIRREMDPKLFEAKLDRVKKAHPFGAMVEQKGADEYAGMRLFMSNDGKSGFALKPDGDIVSVFSGEKGRFNKMMKEAKAEGGKKLDAFAAGLPEMYARHGFHEVGRFPWDGQYAPKDWKPWLGTPDVVMMELPKTPPRAYSAPYREPKMPLYNRTGIYSALLGLGGLGGGILDERGR